MPIVKEKQKNKTINSESSPIAIFLAQLKKKCNFATKYPKELICVAAKFRISSLFALSNTSKD